MSAWALTRVTCEITPRIERAISAIHPLVMISAKCLRTGLCCIGLAVAVPLFAADPILPDLNLTPGVYRKDLNDDQICNTKWGLDKRHVTPAMKKKVFEEYRIPYGRHSEFEVDHLISRELGGADDIKNLWPESYVTQPWNAHRKDRLENYLHKLLCLRKITLEEARKEITNDWTVAYKKYFGEPTTVPVKSNSKHQ